MTKIIFDYAEREAFNRFANAAKLSKRVENHTYVDIINIYLRQTKHEELWDVRIYETSTYDKVYLTYYYVKNDSYRKLEHMAAIEKIIQEHYHLVDFEEFDGDHVRLEMVSND